MDFFFYRMPISWDIDMGSLANKELKVQLKSHRPSLSGSSLPMFTHNIVSTMNSYLSLSRTIYIIEDLWVFFMLNVTIVI